MADTNPRTHGEPKHETVYRSIYLTLLICNVVLVPWLTYLHAWPMRADDPLCVVFWTNLAYFVCSLRRVPDGHGVAIWVLGFPAWDMGLGYVYVPFLLGKLTPIPRVTFQREFPADPEKVFHGTEREQITTGAEEFRPILITTGDTMKTFPDGTPYNGGKHLNNQTTVRQQASVEWNIDRKHPFDFLIRNDSEGLSPKEGVKANFVDLDPKRQSIPIDMRSRILDVEKKLGDSIVGSLQTYYPNYSLGGIIVRLKSIEAQTLTDLENRTNRNGVNIIHLVVKQPIVDEKTNSALEEIIRSSARIESGINAGKEEGGKKRAAIEEEATGTANAAETMGLDAADVFALKQIKETIGANDKFIFGGAGLSEVMTGVASAATGLLRRKPKKPATTDKTDGGTP